MLTSLKALLTLALMIIVGGTIAFLWLVSQDISVSYDSSPIVAPSARPEVKPPDYATRRIITNKGGREITAYLLSKTDKTVTFITSNQRYSVFISTLMPEDQEFIKNWTPQRPNRRTTVQSSTATE